MSLRRRVDKASTPEALDALRVELESLRGRVAAKTVDAPPDMRQAIEASRQASAPKQVTDAHRDNLYIDRLVDPPSFNEALIAAQSALRRKGQR
jgi:hypothetical protein